MSYEVTEQRVLVGWLLLTPIIIWTTTFIWACIRVCRKGHHDQMSEDRKRWEAHRRGAVKRTVRRMKKTRSRQSDERRRRTSAPTVGTPKTVTTMGTTGTGGTTGSLALGTPDKKSVTQQPVTK